jgi:hypothetical protein
MRDGWTLAAAAEAAGVSVRTVSKWLRRFREEGELGLLDRCSAPSSVPLRTGESRVAVIASLRRLRMTGAEIAETLGMPVSTVSGILTRIGLGKLWRLEPLEPPNRYEKRRPGELVHVDVKKLGRIGRPGHRVTGRVSGGGHHRRAYRLGWEERPRLRRRRDPARLRRSPRRRESRHRYWLPPPSGRPLRRLRHPGGAADDG